MTSSPATDPRLDATERTLRAHGARFAFLHGSTVDGSSTTRSDIDVGAWFGTDVDPVELSAELPANVDLLVLDAAPLELAGRVALHGVVLFDDDPAARVEWQATTRKIYLDEQPRIRRARREFVEARARG